MRPSESATSRSTNAACVARAGCFILALLTAAIGGRIAGAVWFGLPAASRPLGTELAAKLDASTLDETPALAPKYLTFASAAEPRQGRLRREHDLYLAVQELGARDFELVGEDPAGLTVIAKQLQDMNYEFRMALVAAFVSRWAEFDKSAALAWFQRDAGLLKANRAMREWVNRAFIRKLPEDVFALGLKRDKNGGGLPSLFIEELAQEKPELARKFIERFTNEKDRASAESGWCMALARKDPFAAVDLMAKLTDKSQLRLISDIAIATAARGGAGELRALAERVTEPAMRRDVVSVMAAHDPEEAARLAESLLAKSNATELQQATGAYLGAVSEAYVRKNPSAAAPWADGLSGEARAVAMSEVAKTWAARDPQAALAWFAEHPSPADDHEKPLPLRRDARMDAFGVWLKVDENAAREWAATLPPGEMCDAARAGLILRLAASGRANEAAQLCGEFSPEPTGWLARRVAEQIPDPLTAAAWAAQLPPGRPQEFAVTASVRRWTELDPAAAARWLEQFPASPVRDRATSAYVQTSARADAEAAAPWIDQIADPWLRERAAQAVFWGEWRDLARAREWLLTLPGIDEKTRHWMLSHQR